MGAARGHRRQRNQPPARHAPRYPGGVIGHDGPAKADTHPVGEVVKRVSIRHGGVFLVVTTKHRGETKNVSVSRPVFARCSKGETYPKCAKGGAE